MNNKKEYLGDAVYASFDGYHIWLHTEDGNNNKIALEPEVFQKLLEYHDKLVGKTANE
jgi:hypothetical protein